jgi:predicted GNAT family acetyltransferase
MQAPFRALALAPVSVAPERQKAGIGSALVRSAVERARQAGWEAVFVLGDPAYYGRFGFDAHRAAGFSTPYAGEHFMVPASRRRFRPASARSITRRLSRRSTKPAQLVQDTQATAWRSTSRAARAGGSMAWYAVHTFDGPSSSSGGTVVDVVTFEAETDEEAIARGEARARVKLKGRFAHLIGPHGRFVHLYEEAKE